MGSTAAVSIGGKHYTSFDYIDPSFLSLFTKDDLKIYKIENNKRAGYVVDVNDDSFKTEIALVSDIGTIKKRLQLLGLSYSHVKNEFDQAVSEEIELLESRKDYPSIIQDEDLEMKIQNELDILNELKFDEYVLCSKKIIENGLIWSLFEDVDNVRKDTITEFLLGRSRNMFSSIFLGNDDERNLLRAMSDYYQESVEVKYEITELVIDDFEEMDSMEDFGDYIYFKESLSYEYKMGEKLIILTEGSTDSNILRKSMQLLFPRIAPYFSFMDFGIANVQGSAGSLTNTVKSFIGAGIRNRIIAIYDNDTGGYSAILPLKKINLPPNVTVMNYPDIDLAKQYPTIGPSGLDTQDINKRAVSIELFFGMDVLVKDGSFIPVQWKGYDEGIGAYQGVIQEKDLLTKKFFHKLDLCLAEPEKLDNYDWKDMRYLLETIINVIIEE